MGKIHSPVRMLTAKADILYTFLFSIGFNNRSAHYHYGKFSERESNQIKSALCKIHSPVQCWWFEKTVIFATLFAICWISFVFGARFIYLFAMRDSPFSIRHFHHVQDVHKNMCYKKGTRKWNLRSGYRYVEIKNMLVSLPGQWTVLSDLLYFIKG